jgi:erythromycin esterase-like protein
MATEVPDALEAVRAYARPLTGADDDHDALVERIGSARFVLLGEASHGTHEFYRERARITRRLVEEHGFDAVAVEADWPDAARANRYVRLRGEDRDAGDALADFRRFPTWMWRNTVTAEFLEWLRRYNVRLPEAAAGVGFYGLDLYSLHSSFESVISYLRCVDPAAADRARERFSCFDHRASADYGLQAAFGAGGSCEDDAVAQLVELCREAARYASEDEDAFFDAERNARLVVDAEEYYRTMFRGQVSSWNLRDRHMAETLDALVDHLGRRRGRAAKVVVWAHNSHLGDARATDRAEVGEWNLGQLVREGHPGEVVNVGFTTFAGTVTAAHEWGGKADRQQLQPGLPGSYERLLHDSGGGTFLLLLGEGELPHVLGTDRLERAIGVIYRPATERTSHYFDARLAEQFDAVVHVDESTALEPLDSVAVAGQPDLPEAYPTGE